MSFSDETLSAYLDGEADPATARGIEAAMQSDPDLVARMEGLGANDRLLRDAFDETLGEPPARLTGALDAEGPSAKVLEFRPRARTAAPASGWRRIAAATALVVVAAAAVGMLSLPRPGPLLSAASDGRLAAGPALGRALASTASGAPAKVSGQPMQVALSFRSRDGRLCRQFRLGASEGVACRARGGWSIEGWMAGQPQATGAYQTAGGPDASPINGVVDRLGVAQALDRPAEAAAIRSGWRRMGAVSAAGGPSPAAR